MDSFREHQIRGMVPADWRNIAANSHRLAAGTRDAEVQLAHRLIGLEGIRLFAAKHDCCDTEQARIEGDWVVIPVDAFGRDGSHSVEHFKVRTMAEASAALGY